MPDDIDSSGESNGTDPTPGITGPGNEDGGGGQLPDTSTNAGGEGNQLPDTATNMYNLLLIGGILLMLGIAAFFVRRKQKIYFTMMRTVPGTVRFLVCQGSQPP